MTAALRRIALALLVTAAGLAACTGGANPDGWQRLSEPPSDSARLVSISGRIRYLDIEGGTFVLDDGRGTRYSPVNLPDEFRTDGVAVEADVVAEDGMVSITMVGPLVRVIRIRRTPEP